MDFRKQFLVTSSSENLDLSQFSTRAILGLSDEELKDRLKKNRKKKNPLQQLLVIQLKGTNHVDKYA